MQEPDTAHKLRGNILLHMQRLHIVMAEFLTLSRREPGPATEDRALELAQFVTDQLMLLAIDTRALYAEAWEEKQ